jgi:hypothetical protein
MSAGLGTGRGMDDYFNPSTQIPPAPKTFTTYEGEFNYDWITWQFRDYVDGARERAIAHANEARRRAMVCRLDNNGQNEFIAWTRVAEYIERNYKLSSPNEAALTRNTGDA